MRDYLAEAVALAESDAPFHVLAHLDYPARYWPGRFVPTDFEPEIRAVLTALAGSAPRAGDQHAGSDGGRDRVLVRPRRAATP